MKFLCILIFAVIISITSFIYTLGGLAQATENANINQALSQLPKGSFGFIIWMSNREGNWNIYRMDIPSGKTTKLTQDDADDNDARISDDGKLIAWNRGDKYKHDVWIMNADGTDKRLVVSNASMGIWGPDGRIVVYRGKDYNTSFIYDPDTKKETKVCPLENVEVEPKGFWRPTPSPDGKMIVSWADNPRGIWVLSADGKFQKHVHGGCDGSFAPDGSFIYWIIGHGGGNVPRHCRQSELTR